MVKQFIRHCACIWLCLAWLTACGIQPQTPPVVQTPSSTPAGTSLPDDPPQKAPPENMALVPAGPFTMGSEQETALAECEKYFSGCDPNSWYLNETPVHEVSLDAFYLDLYEVTNRQYQDCVADGGCTEPERHASLTRTDYYGEPEFGDYPVIWVTWRQAQAYCEWHGARLPTEAEWEKAARGTEARLYPWGESFEAGEANFCDLNCTLEWANGNFDDGFPDTSPVGAFPSGASPYGIYDLGGNVNEWVADWYAAGYYSESPESNPSGPASGSQHSIRGGSFHTPGQGLRTTARPLSAPSADHIGFRCAQSPD